MRILVVEDDLALCDALSFHLKHEGYDVDVCHDGEDALTWMLQRAHDLVVLDRMLPGMDGLSALAAARKRGFTTPVLFLTALGELNDRIQGLDAGADDYLTKPFETEELLARIRAMTRRPRQWLDDSRQCACADLALDTANLQLTGASGTVTLSKRETQLLETLMRSAGQTLPRETIFVRVWGTDADVEDANLDSYIHFLRKRLDAVGSCVKITTVRGVGFRLEES
jgi:Response regulators consisting of a CheY-like receiver domain and a winged-helix DNA-binding domain